MDLYTAVAYENSRQLTRRYSTSFASSSALLGKKIRPHIYAIYALVRIADEIVDTYKGADSLQLLNDLETETYAAIPRGYSTNTTVHAFAQTAKQYDISKELIAPFFESMRMDLSPHTYNDALYATYIHGSAEVVGLMCLKVFVEGNKTAYDTLAPGASALGAAYQKVNFLRDLAADYNDLGRLYFPDVTYESFDETAKNHIIQNIKKDFKNALPAIEKLPRSSKKATLTSYEYYHELLKRLETTPAERIKQTRIRVPNGKKLQLLVKATLSGPS